MSSPPPGGPPTPQQPYAQQPYYAQPAAPPPKKSNALLIVVIVVVVVVVVAAVAWYAITLMFRPVTNQLTVTGVSWTVEYPGSTSYFGTSPLTTCSACPIAVVLPWQFNYTLSLTNSDIVARNVTDISVSGLYFNLLSATPDPSTSSPVVINAGASRSFVLSIQATPFTGSRTLTGSIHTT